MTGPSEVLATAPGRANLIGDHTDYTGGWCLPIAIGLATTVRYSPGQDGQALSVTSAGYPGEVVIDEGRGSLARAPGRAGPRWSRYVAAVARRVAPGAAGRLEITSTLPSGAGLSSSAALEVAVALALGFEGSALELALTCQLAEVEASGVPCGIMDQLVIASAVAGSALLIECATPTFSPVALPEYMEILVTHSGESRSLAASRYASRREECERAAAIVGPLASASEASLLEIADPVTRRRARHVVTENQRVLAAVDALGSGALEDAGVLMDESHNSLAVDFEVSSTGLDATVAQLRGVDGVLGARMTGGGFGGCVVSIARHEVTLPDELARRTWSVKACGGARRVDA